MDGAGPLEWRQGGFSVSTDPARLDLGVVHGFLSSSYWARGIPLATVARSLANSLCFGVYEELPAGARQVGFARAITDRATYAYLADVFVLEPFRGRGLARFLLHAVVSHPDLQGLRRWSLATRDAHGLYRRFGFTEMAHPERFLERLAADVYRKVEDR